MLSQFHLSLGYVQESRKENTRVELYKEHGCYHIRAFNYDLAECRLAWESTRRLTYARKQYRAMRRLLDHRG